MAAASTIPASRVDEVLIDVGLESAAGQRTGGFSLGMRQRLALAGALLGDPQVLLLDEPSNGLDPDGIHWLCHHLTEFARRGGSVFVSSHLISELSMFADDLVVVGGGALLAADTVEAITARQAAIVVAETPRPADLARVLAGPHVTVEATGDRLVVRGATKATVSQLAFENGIRRVRLRLTSQTLRPLRTQRTRTMNSTSPTIPWTTTDRSAVRTRSDDVRAVRAALQSEWIKLTALRANKVILALTAVIGALIAGVLASSATDPTFTGEAQHGTLVSRPGRCGHCSTSPWPP